MKFSVLNRGQPAAILDGLTTAVITLDHALRITYINSAAESLFGLSPNRLPQKEPVNVHQVLEHVRQLIEAEAPTGIIVLRDYDPSIPEVLADREQLIQAALNIARNALQALSGQADDARGRGMIVL